MPSKLRCDFIAEVAGVVLDGVGTADAESEPSDGAVDTVESHGEMIGRYPPSCCVRGLARTQLEREVAVAKDSDVVEQRQWPHPGSRGGAIVPPRHSLRNAVSGSTCAARRAGIQFATSVAAAMTTVTPASVQRS